MTDQLKFGDLVIKLNPEAVKVLGDTVKNITAGFAAMGEMLVNACRGFEQLNKNFPPTPEYHSFRPDFDLRCTVKYCDKLPEEH